MIKLMSTLAVVASTQVVQAHIVNGVEHTHESRNYFQPMSAMDNLNFRNENHNNMELMSAQEREAFMAGMNNGTNLNRSTQSGMRGNMQSMTTQQRQDFRNQMQSMSDQERQIFRDGTGGGQGGMNSMNRGGMGGRGRH